MNIDTAPPPTFQPSALKGIACLVGGAIVLLLLVPAFWILWVYGKIMVTPYAHRLNDPTSTAMFLVSLLLVFAGVPLVWWLVTRALRYLRLR